MDTKEDKDIFKRVIFEPCDTETEVSSLTEVDQKKSLARFLSQKIAFEAVYRSTFPQENVTTPDNYYHPPSILAYICCCLYPEQYQSVFGVTTQMFKKKCIGILKFWKNDFLEIQNIDEEEPDKPPNGPDLYGPIWLIVTYVILLGLASNLNDYFSLPNHNTAFLFVVPYLTSAVALNLLFRFGEVFLYPSVMGCFDGQLSNTECAHLIGYSIILYIIPTVFCIIPLKLMHMVMLILAAMLRGVFLARNFASRIRSPTSKGIVYFVVGGVQAMEYIIASSAFFTAYYVAPVATFAGAPTGHPLLRTVP